jgi:hypothetical protein
MPWGGNPTGALLAPVFVLAMIYGRKKKRGKVDALIILAVLCLGVGMSLVACAPEPPATDLPLDLQATITSTETPTPVHTIDLTTATGTTVFHAEVPAAPSVTPSPSCTLTLLSYYKSELLSTYGVELLDSVPGGTGESVWTERLAYNAYRAVVDVANILGGPSRFREIYHTSDGNLVMKKVTTYTERVKVDCKGNHKPTDVCYEDVSHNYGGITNGEHDIQFASINYVAEDSVRNNIVHELGHAYDDGHGTPSGDMPDKFVRDRNLFLRPDDSVIWQIHKPETPSDSNPVETYADMFVAYVYDAWVQPNRFSPNPQTWMEGTIK